jgi:hypothetical protein
MAAETRDRDTIWPGYNFPVYDNIKTPLVPESPQPSITSASRLKVPYKIFLIDSLLSYGLDSVPILQGSP